MNNYKATRIKYNEKIRLKNIKCYYVRKIENIILMQKEGGK